MQELSNNITLVLGASVFLLLITLFIVFILMAYKRRDYRHLREKKKLEEEYAHQLLQSQIEVQELTFQQIGKELHDNVGQLLSTSKMLIGLAERTMQAPPDTLITAHATLGKAITELRSLSKSLDKEWLAQFNLIENLTAEINRINAAKNIIALLNTELLQLEMASEKQIILFRIIQEAIQNALKHSKCTRLNISLSQDENGITCIIADNGEGFNMKEIDRGMGLNNMLHRVKLLEGAITHEAAIQQGATIKISIPKKMKNEN